MEEGAGNTSEEHSTLPTFPCNNIDLSFGCSISPALWAEGTVQDSSHCQGREEEISKEWCCPPAGAHSEQTAYLEHRHGHDGGGYLRVGRGSKGEGKAKQKQKIMWQLQRLSIRKAKQCKIKKKNLLKAYFSFRLFTVVNRNPTNPFSWEQHLFMWAVRLKQGRVAQVSKDAHVQKGWQRQTMLSKYPTFRNTNDSSL